MNALTSYLRHLIVTGLVLLVEKQKLPLEGAEEAANVIALAVVGTAVWAAAKYTPEWARRIGLLAAVCLVLPGLQSCADYPLSLSAQTDEGNISYSSKGGLVITVDQRSGK